MRLTRLVWDGADAGDLVAELRSGAAAPEALGKEVAAIIAAVRHGGDEALRGLVSELDGVEAVPAELRVPQERLDHALEGIDPDLKSALELAAANIRTVAEAERAATEPIATDLPQGHRVEIVASPVASAGIYAPGGRAAYPSSVLMAGIPASVAGVGRIVMTTPPDQRGEVSQSVLAAASLAGVSEVYAMGGAHAIAALAFGTESIEPVHVVAGPGNAWVTEAKRQLYGTVGIDALAGPSELVVVADETADAREVALDALAQAEHGDDSPVIVIAIDTGLLDRVQSELESLAAERASVANAPFTLVETPSLSTAVQLSDSFAPEHLELRFAGADHTAHQRVAGCVFTGSAGATAFGDYVAGSNHVLPTGGAARFGGPLGVQTYMRRSSVVTIEGEAAAALAPAADAIARAEGLPVHGESARIRADG